MNFPFNFSEQGTRFCVDVLSAYSFELCLDACTEQEKAIIETYSREKRKLEFAASRQLLRNMLGDNYKEIEYAPSGKPYMRDMQISLSHSKEYIGGICNAQKNVAIDIEQFQDKILSLAFRFMNSQEFASYTSIHDITLVWCAKEVLFKLWNDSPDFREHYSITQINGDFEKGTITAEVRTVKFEKVIVLSYFRTQELCIVWGVSPEL